MTQVVDKFSRTWSRIVQVRVPLDMECVLTTLSLVRGAGGAQLLRGPEAARARSILTRALHAEAHGHAAPLTEEHPDGREHTPYVHPGLAGLAVASCARLVPTTQHILTHFRATRQYAFKERNTIPYTQFTS